MAKVQGPLMSEQATGKIGGMLVFSGRAVLRASALLQAIIGP